MKMSALERRAQEVASALAFVAALTAREAVDEIMSASTARQVSRECRRAVAVLAKLAEDKAATEGSAKPLAAKNHLGALEAALKEKDYVAVEKRARGVLRALGARLPRTYPGPKDPEYPHRE